MTEKTTHQLDTINHINISRHEALASLSFWNFHKENREQKIRTTNLWVTSLSIISHPLLLVSTAPTLWIREFV